MRKSYYIGIWSISTLILWLSWPSVTGYATPRFKGTSSNFELSVSTIHSQKHPLTTGFILPLLREWEWRAKNSVRFTYYNPGTVYGQEDMLLAARAQLLDLTLAPLYADMENFPASSVISLPFMFTNARAAALTFLEAVEVLPQFHKEMKDWKLIFLSTSAPTNLYTTRPVQSLDDLRGMRIGVLSRNNLNIVRYLGAVPRLVSRENVYFSLLRGGLDGCLLPPHQVLESRVAEVAKYVTFCNIQCHPLPLLMSRQNYQRLPPIAQEALESMGEKALTAAASSMPDYYSLTELRWLKEFGQVQVLTLSPAERERWQQAVEPMEDLWAVWVSSMGVEEPYALLEHVRALAQKYNTPVVQRETLDACRYRLGPTLVPDAVYNTLWHQEPQRQPDISVLIR